MIMNRTKQDERYVTLFPMGFGLVCYALSSYRLIIILSQMRLERGPRSCYDANHCRRVSRISRLLPMAGHFGKEFVLFFFRKLRCSGRPSGGQLLAESVLYMSIISYVFGTILTGFRIYCNFNLYVCFVLLSKTVTITIYVFVRVLCVGNECAWVCGRTMCLFHLLNPV